MGDVAQVQKLIGALLADVDAVAAGEVILTKRANELAVGVKDDNRVHGRIEPLVLDVNEAGRIDADAVGRLPAQVPGQPAPVVNALVAIVALADNRVLGTGLVSGTENARGGA